MKNHIFRPLLVVIALVVAFLVVRAWFVPKAFGVHERGYTYGWYNQANEQVWKNVSLKFRAPEDCRDCHEENASSVASSPHGIILCQNCHGPALDHPTNPESLEINTNRGLCLRCHVALPYPTSQRARIAGIDPLTHNPTKACVTCHNPHDPTEEVKP